MSKTADEQNLMGAQSYTTCLVLGLEAELCHDVQFDGVRTSEAVKFEFSWSMLNAARLNRTHTHLRHLGGRQHQRRSSRSVAGVLALGIQRNVQVDTLLGACLKHPDMARICKVMLCVFASTVTLDEYACVVVRLVAFGIRARTKMLFSREFASVLVRRCHCHDVVHVFHKFHSPSSSSSSSSSSSLSSSGLSS